MAEDDARRTLPPSEDEALDAWRALHDAVEAQRQRLLGGSGPADYWGSIAEIFTPGPHGYPAPELPLLEALARPEDAWLEVGAGAGRLAIPLAPRVARMHALDASPGMIARLREEVAAAGLRDFEVLPPHAWPPGEEAPAGIPKVDVVLAASVVFFVREIGAFLDAMERHARRLCTVVVMDRMPGTPLEALWSRLHDEPLAVTPELDDFLAVLGARGRPFELRTVRPPPPQALPLEEALAQTRRRYLVRAGSALDGRMRELLLERYGEPDGRVTMPLPFSTTGVVTWEPPV
jgi:SAM-dependent methyltransferase